MLDNPTRNRSSRDFAKSRTVSRRSSGNDITQPVVSKSLIETSGCGARRNQPNSKSTDFENHRLRIVACDKKSHELLNQLETLAELDGTRLKETDRRPLKHILLNGERGVGKELYARFLHDASGRRAEKFLAFNLGALSKELALSALFGHKKGSFTGAVADHAGLIKTCENGTLFLDELDEADKEVQAMLKRVVEYGTYTPVGAQETIKTNGRFVFATNRTDLQSSGIKADLLDRFWTVRIPPLRERRGDIVPLAQQFAADFGRELDDTALEFLETYDWHGNIRELKNTIERACLSANGEISVTQVEQAWFEARSTVEAIKQAENEPPNSCATLTPHSSKLPMFKSGDNLEEFLTKIESHLILKALENNNHNQTRAAEELGLSRTGLIKKIKRIKAAK